jgi:hypothetical protein
VSVDEILCNERRVSRKRALNKRAIGDLSEPLL